METRATCQVAIGFRDREGRNGITTIHLPFSTPIATAISFAFAFASVLQGASDALVISAKVTYRFKESVPSEAGIDSNIYRKAVLFYRNEEGYEALTIPSPKQSVFESQGVYAGIRIERTATEMFPFVVPIGSVVTPLVTPEGEPFPQEYVVGGLSE